MALKKYVNSGPFIKSDFPFQSIKNVTKWLFNSSRHWFALKYKISTLRFGRLVNARSQNNLKSRF